MSELAVRVEGLGKEYRLGGPLEQYSTLRDRLSKLASAPFRALRGRGERSEQDGLFWALKDVSFEVKRGEVVGIIGRNGAGKSTLLKILSRITEPTEGEVDINGRVGSLLEVGTGFHPELSGRENVYLNGAILGMQRADNARRFDEIVAFADVEKFIDTPAKHYSSGMYMRLAFAVAAHLEPEILIVDEVLAVGDAQFQKKCLGKMGDVARGGRTVIFVSHNMGAVQSLCRTAIHLDAGQIVAKGSTTEVVGRYLSLANELLRRATIAQPHLGDLILQNLSFQPQIVPSGGSTSVTVEIYSPSDAAIHALCLLLYSMADTRVAVIDLRDQHGPHRVPAGKTVAIEVDVRRLPLVEGEYKVGLYIKSANVDVNFLDLAMLEVTPREDRPPVLPYPAMHRGFVELECSTLRVAVR